VTVREPEYKNAVLLDVMPSGSCMNRCSGGTYRLYYKGEKNERARNNVSISQQLKHTAKK
jgi:hypothetical protein